MFFIVHISGNTFCNVLFNYTQVQYTCHLDTHNQQQPFPIYMKLKVAKFSKF